MIPVLYVANVGDSRAVLYEENFFALRMSYDHKGFDAKEYQRIMFFNC